MHHKSPTRLQAAVFSAKAFVHRGSRFIADRNLELKQFKQGDTAKYPVLLAESRSKLWIAESLVEQSLQFGKVQNLRKACASLHLAEVPAGQTFSFWKQIGRANRSSGYMKGRELRQGCLIPTVGGGLCQVSNALYDAALRSGCEIVERHAHTAAVPGSAAEQGRDATVFWNYVDLRFRPQQDTLITVRLTTDELVLSFWGKQPFSIIDSHPINARAAAAINTCTDCGMEDCFRHMPLTSATRRGITAFLIEECWPEFDRFVQQSKSGDDELYLPFYSRFVKQQRHGWTTDGFARVVAANLLTSSSALRLRLGLSNGHPPILEQIQRSHALAAYYGERLSISSTHLYVAQSLLPALWRRGDLGGRSFSVLMTRLPLHVLHKKLDELVARYPERKTFSEFRAPKWMVEAEAEALERADSIITPHALLADLYPHKTKKLGWHLPVRQQARLGSLIAFPGPSLARKGAYEVRAVMKDFSQPLITTAGAVETTDFWDGRNVVPAGQGWLNQAAVVVQPAFIENVPRPLLSALAAGIPVIASRECGIEDHPSLTLVQAGDVQGLTQAIRQSLGQSAPPAS